MENLILDTIIQAIANKGTTAVNDCYTALKDFIVKKLGKNNAVERAVTALEEKSDSKGRQAVLQKELASSDLLNKADFIEIIKQLQEVLLLTSTNSTKINQKYKGDNGMQFGQVNGPVNIGMTDGSIKYDIQSIIATANLVDRSKEFIQLSQCLTTALQEKCFKPIIANIYGPEYHYFDVFIERWKDVLLTDFANDIRLINILPDKPVRIEADYTIEKLLRENAIKRIPPHKTIAIQPLTFVIRKGHWKSYKSLFRQWVDYWCNSYQQYDGYVPFIMNCIETDKRLLNFINADKHCENEVTQLLKSFMDTKQGANANILMMNQFSKIDEQHLTTWVQQEVKKYLSHMKIDTAKLSGHIKKTFFPGKIKEVTYLDIRDELIDKIKECIE